MSQYSRSYLATILVDNEVGLEAFFNDVVTACKQAAYPPKAGGLPRSFRHQHYGNLNFEQSL